MSMGGTWGQSDRNMMNRRLRRESGGVVFMRVPVSVPVSVLVTQ